MEGATTDDPVGWGDSLNRYSRLLKYGGKGSSMEAAGDHADPDLSDPAISQRLKESSHDLDFFIKEYLNDDAASHEIAREIMKNGDLALRVLRDKDEKKVQQHPKLLQSLEVIVRIDGSRPSFMIRDGKVDRQTSPIGVWGGVLDASDEFLREVVNWVGRIDFPEAEQGFVGTGFLVHQNLIVTNRHVMQLITDKQADGSWTVKRNVTIDFGHEFRARLSLNRRAVKNVIFAGAQPINSPIVHTKLDLALLELETQTGDVRPDSYFTINIAPELVTAGTTVYTIGYPGNPGPFEVPFTLLEQLFRSTFGHKRLAPGIINSSMLALPKWTMAHDATTLGGNSGSPVIITGREKTACILHYGGRSAEPRENYGHHLALVIDEKDARGKSLRDCLGAFNIELKDPFGGN